MGTTDTTARSACAGQGSRIDSAAHCDRARTRHPARGVPLSLIWCRKPQPKSVHDVTVKHSEAGQAWIWKEAARIGGPIVYKTRSPFWAITIIAFDSQEKAAELEGLLVGGVRSTGSRE